MAVLDTYTGLPPGLVLLDITEDIVTEIVGRLSVGAGLGGADSVSLQYWLLIFGASSGYLRLTVADFSECIANRQPPWAAYRELTSGRLIALDKHPGFRPFGVGETCRRLMVKFILRVTGKEAKAACGMY